VFIFGKVRVGKVDVFDDYNFPTKGDSNNLKASVALPVADFKYYKFDASHKSYRSLTSIKPAMSPRVYIIQTI
jgi:outer membrane protein assembly factor BamA